MRRILTIAALILTATLSAESVPLPQDAQQAIDRETAQENALKADLDAKVATLHRDLVAKLERAETAATKRGSLDQAEAIKARIDTLKPKAAGANEPDKPVLKGAYRCTHTNDPLKEIDFRADGTAISAFGDHLTWTIENNVVTLQWKDGTTSRGDYHPNTITLTSSGKMPSGEDRCNYVLEKE